MLVSTLRLALIALVKRLSQQTERIGTPIAPSIHNSFTQMILPFPLSLVLNVRQLMWCMPLNNP